MRLDARHLPNFISISAESLRMSFHDRASRGICYDQKLRRRSMAFFGPRRTDVSSINAKTPGYVVSNWRDPISDRKTGLKRVSLPRIKQNFSSPPGMSKLPYELLDQIVRELCGREIANMRLVCTDWELASRPFFAHFYLHKLLLWMAGSQLLFFKQLALKFGPYMKSVYIASDHFTISGLFPAIKNYHLYCKSRNLGPIHTSYLSLNTKKLFNMKQSLHWKHCSHTCTRSLFISWVAYSFSQTWLRLTHQDRRLLSELIALLPPSCEVEVVDLSYHGEELRHNVAKYGRAAPGFTFEMALFNTQALETYDAETLTRDVEYEMYLRQLLLNVS